MYCPMARRLCVKTPPSSVINGFYLSVNSMKSKQYAVSIAKKSTYSTATMAKDKESRARPLTMDTLNPNVKVMEYAVRGPLVIRAVEIERELEQGAQKPFKQVLQANIGDCHAMGQIPITFIRQVLALVSYPELFDNAHFSPDAKRHAQEILKGCKGSSVGSYTDSAGIPVIRRHAAEYIQKRDGGVPSSWENVVLCAGASEGIKQVMKLLICPIDGKPAGVMIPIPQYPLYTATIAEFGLEPISYYLNEEAKWSLDVDELERSLDVAKRTCAPRAIVVINPGNPTGQVLTEDNIKAIIKFAYKNSLFIFADEVYQDNVYDKQSKFHSFKKVLTEMGKPYSEMQLASFMSCSKGYMGECGIRGGYTEIINLDPEVKAMYLKSISAGLCPTTLGQTVMDCVVNPPSPGDESYEQYVKEKNKVLSDLNKRATLVAETFNAIDGITCNPVMGAMYAFPNIRMPPKAIEEAKKRGQSPDVLYAFELLESTGICIVPGSGFGQKPGTYHIRTTILPQTDKLVEMLNKFKEFHEQFLKRYS